MAPTIGRIVHYILTEQDAEAINRRRADFADAPAGNTGFVGHVGNEVRPGQIFPAMVVANWGGTAANLQVILDGNDTYWATSRCEGEPGSGSGKGGTWFWPPRS